MALVDVEHLRRETEGGQGSGAAHAEEDLLADPLLLGAAVEAIGDQPVLVGVVVDVGVEQVQRDAADVGLPHPGVHRRAGDVDGDADAVDRRERDGRGVEPRKELLLAAPEVELLREVAVVVEEPDPGEGQADVVGGLEVVAGEHAETAAVLGEPGGHAELGGEVGHALERRPLLGTGAVLEPTGRGQPPHQLVADGGGEVDERVVGGELGEALGRFRGEQAGGVALVVEALPVHPAEQLLGPLVVDPRQVGCDLRQRLQGLRDS